MQTKYIHLMTLSFPPVCFSVFCLFCLFCCSCATSKKKKSITDLLTRWFTINRVFPRPVCAVRWSEWNKLPSGLVHLWAAVSESLSPPLPRPRPPPILSSDWSPQCRAAPPGPGCCPSLRTGCVCRGRPSRARRWPVWRPGPGCWPVAMQPGGSGGSSEALQRFAAAASATPSPGLRPPPDQHLDRKRKFNVSQRRPKCDWKVFSD